MSIYQSVWCFGSFELVFTIRLLHLHRVSVLRNNSQNLNVRHDSIALISLRLGITHGSQKFVYRSNVAARNNSDLKRVAKYLLKKYSTNISISAQVRVNSVSYSNGTL
jgi:hypothetical protein